WSSVLVVADSSGIWHRAIGKLIRCAYIAIAIYVLSLRRVVVFCSNWGFCLDFFSFFCRLDVYIYDYLLKRNLQTTAKAFMAEGKVSADPVGNKFVIPRRIVQYE
ncbi:hypothetical protein B296_00024042, partial [Ensete ventricosum]